MGEQVIVPFRELKSKIKEWRKKYATIVLTTGAFDILNLGHCYYLEDAAKQGDFLIVGVDTDELVRSYKGPDRPINSARFRAQILTFLKPVGCVTIFEDIIKLVKILKPDIFVTSPTTGVSLAERKEVLIIQKQGGKVISLASRHVIHTSDTLKAILSCKKS